MCVRVCDCVVCVIVLVYACVWAQYVCVFLYVFVICVIVCICNMHACACVYVCVCVQYYNVSSPSLRIAYSHPSIEFSWVRNWQAGLL
jgi:hypothetical protein